MISGKALLSSLVTRMPDTVEFTAEGEIFNEPFERDIDGFVVNRANDIADRISRSRTMGWGVTPSGVTMTDDMSDEDFPF